MPLKIRCPHCERVLSAEDSTIGEQRRCPSCDGVFNVPIPVRSAAPAGSTRRCRHCDLEIGLTSRICSRCLTNQESGRRLPLLKRLGRGSKRDWLLVTAGCVAVTVAAGFGIARYREHTRELPKPFEPIRPVDVDTRALARHLLTAPDAAARRAAEDAIRRSGTDCSPALAAELLGTLQGSERGPERLHNQMAALHLIGKLGTDVAPAADRDTALPVVRKAQEVAHFREAALAARARLGDREALAELIAGWLELRRDALLLNRIAELKLAWQEAGMVQARRALTLRALVADDGLRDLASDPTNPVFDQLAATMWQTGSWLGQRHGEGFASHFFDLAKPPRPPSTGSDLTFQAEEIRAARRELRRVSENGPPLALAAAGVILVQCMPQYQTLRDDIMARLSKALPTAGPAEQQRLTWALARLSGRPFADLGSDDGPYDVSPAAISAALRWAAESSGGAAKTTKPPAPPERPRLRRRVVSAAAQMERDLIPLLRGDWSSMPTALGRWQNAGLPWTVGLERLIDPAQHKPSLPGLAAGMALAATLNAQSARPQLELWRVAADQPAWVRGAAQLSVAALDAQRGTLNPRALVDLDLGELRALDVPEPGWDLFGRILSAGGPQLSAAVRDAAALSPAARNKLIEAARRIRDSTGPESAK